MKNMIKTGIQFVLIFLLTGFFMQAKSQGFDKAAYYKVLEGGNLVAVDNKLKLIEAATDINKESYSGALLMKRAGLVKGPSKKLNVFKEGHEKLEAAIKKENDNAEWHFLRLVIQEHAPKILGYRADIDKDAAIVHSYFKKFSPEVQAAITDYRKQSGALQKLNF